MAATATYRINEPTVIHQTIGGETVIIHLTSGLYYSLEGSGAEIWERIGRGQQPARISDDLSAPTPAERAVIADEVAAFVARLLEEDLVILTIAEDGDALAAARPSDQAVTDGPVPAVGPFRTPRVARYDDLQDLLLLDPIHATDQTGWPERLPDPDGTGADRA